VDDSSPPVRPPFRGRGTSLNPKNRFDRLAYEVDEDLPDEERPAPRTELLRDVSRSIIATNDSPDVGFDASINPYRGCVHGCVYCFARPTHEYLGFSSGLDFETKILVKEDAPELLQKELSSPRWRPRVLALSGVTDAYQPIERRLGITRRCLEVLAEFRNPVMVVTKNHLVTRDVDLLAGLARHEAAAVFLSVTSLRQDVQRIMEPRTSSPARRLDAIRMLSGAGVPTGVLVAPVVPGLTDHEVPAIVEAIAKAGARFAGYVPLRLPFALKEIFERWLEDHFPERKEKVLNRVRSLRGGKLNDPRFGTRLRGEGAYADEIRQLFDLACRQAGIGERAAPLSTAAFRRAAAGQGELFDR
jgi:DNA repair photolyase